VDLNRTAICHPERSRGVWPWTESVLYLQLIQDGYRFSPSDSMGVGNDQVT
jgi:hypothetical protein